MPDWVRDGETWRVEEEPHLVVGHGWCTARDGQYGHDPCGREAFVVGRSSHWLALCETHLRESCAAWVNDGLVVSWRLSR